MNGTAKSSSSHPKHRFHPSSKRHASQQSDSNDGSSSNEDDVDDDDDGYSQPEMSGDEAQSNLSSPTRADNASEIAFHARGPNSFNKDETMFARIAKAAEAAGRRMHDQNEEMSRELPPNQENGRDDGRGGDTPSPWDDKGADTAVPRSLANAIQDMVHSGDTAATTHGFGNAGPLEPGYDRDDEDELDESGSDEQRTRNAPSDNLSRLHGRRQSSKSSEDDQTGADQGLNGWEQGGEEYDTMTMSQAFRGANDAASLAMDTARRIGERRTQNIRMDDVDDSGSNSSEVGDYPGENVAAEQPSELESPEALHRVPFEFDRTGDPRCDAALQYMQQTIARTASANPFGRLSQPTLIMLAQGVTTLLEMGQGIVP